MLKVIYAVFAGLLGAGVVHISTLLLIPVVSESDAWARLSNVTKADTFAIVEPQSQIASSMRALDPNFIVGACQFSLQEGPVLLSGEGKTNFWSLSIFNKRGENLFSINDRISNNGLLDMVIATPLQFIEFQNDMPAELQNSVFAQADVNEGFVILRAFVANDSERPRIKAFVETSGCEEL
ncbi:MAG: DUF1254 domain-containing protein [Rhizobiaceae bacterium]